MPDVYPMVSEQAARVASKIDGAEIGVLSFPGHAREMSAVVATTENAESELETRYSGGWEPATRVEYPVTEDEAAEREAPPHWE